MVGKHRCTQQESRQKMKVILDDLMSKYEQGWNFGDDAAAAACEAGGDSASKKSPGEYYEYYGKLYPKPAHGPGSAKYVR